MNKQLLATVWKPDYGMEGHKADAAFTFENNLTETWSKGIFPLFHIWKICDFDMGGPLYQVIQVCGLHFEDNWPIIRYEEAVSTHAA